MNKNDFYARTMHTPDSPERAELRAALREASKALIPLHRHLIDGAKVDYEAAYERVEKPAQMLRLLTEDPFFSWLQPMTRLIVDIDEMARVDFTDDDAFAIGARIDRMFGTTPDPDFADKYVPMLQREIDVAVGHAAVRKALAKLKR
jgi:hypothetical protein